MIFLVVLTGIIGLLLAVKYPIITLFVMMTTALFKGYLITRVGLFQKVDLTVLATLYVIFGMTVSLIKHPGDFRKIQNGPFLMMILLAGALFFGLIYTSSPNYGWMKSSRYFVFGSIMFLAPLLFIRTVSDVKFLIWFFVISGVLIGIATIFNIQEDRAAFLESGTLGTASKIAMAALVSFCFIINKNSRQSTKIINGFILFLCFIGIVLTGSRGPLFGLIICCMIAPLLFGRRVSLYWLIPGLVVGIVGFGYSMTKAEQVAKASMRRISSIWQEGGGGIEGAFSSRMSYYGYAISNIPHAPVLGHGTGSFAMDYEGEDIPTYPHNVFLELGYENGMVGVLIFTIFLFMLYKRWKEMRIYVNYLDSKDLYYLPVIAVLIFLYTFMQVLKSGDLERNRFFFFCCGFIVSVYNLIVEHAQPISSELHDIEYINE